MCRSCRQSASVGYSCRVRRCRRSSSSFAPTRDRGRSPFEVSGPKLLLADDSLTIQRVIGLTFANENVQVITVPDGEEAIARIALEPPDIVLADIGMPKRNGYDVAAFVKNDPSLAHIPVVLLAGAFEPI